MTRGPGVARPSRWTEVSKRGPSPPLLRPQRRWTFRTTLLVLALCLVGALGGVVVGLGLQPPRAPGQPPTQVTGSEPAVTPDITSALPDASGPQAQLAALRRAVEQEQARLDSLTRSRIAAEAEQQARLDALTRARTAAEAQLAALQRDIAAAQREATSASRREAPLPPIAAPAPLSRPPREAQLASGQPRVFLHHRAGSAAGAETAAALAGTLREGGFDVPDLRPVPAVPSQRVVRYFHAEDAAAAARLAGRLGRGWAIQDFRGYEPSPGPGTLEVWVPDR